MCLNNIILFIRLRLVNNHRNIHLYLSILGLVLAVFCYQVAQEAKKAVVIPIPYVPYIFKEDFWCSDVFFIISCTRIYNVVSVNFLNGLGVLEPLLGEGSPIQGSNGEVMLVFYLISTLMDYIPYLWLFRLPFLFYSIFPIIFSVIKIFITSLHICPLHIGFIIINILLLVNDIWERVSGILSVFKNLKTAVPKPI